MVAAIPLSSKPDDKEVLYFVYPSFPIDVLTLPPFLNSAAFVKILMVPPTAGIANFEAPNPLCTCILFVTSANPDQLDQ